MPRWPHWSAPCWPVLRAGRSLCRPHDAGVGEALVFAVLSGLAVVIVYAAVAVVLDRADARALLRRRLVEEKQ